MTFSGPGYTGYLLNMTSQTWLTANDSDRSVWWHYMAVVVPDELDYKSNGVIWVTGNSNTDSIPTGLNEDEALCISIALGDKVVCTVLWQIPNQPIVFPTDPLHKSRSEDAMIAFTWNHFIMVNQSEPFWLARLPMTKVHQLAVLCCAVFMADFDWLMHAGSGACYGHCDGLCAEEVLQHCVDFYYCWSIQARMDHMDHRRCRQARYCHCAHRHGCVLIGLCVRGIGILCSKESVSMIIIGVCQVPAFSFTFRLIAHLVIYQFTAHADALNFIPNVHHFYQALGGWSFALKDYYAMNFTKEIDLPSTAQVGQRQ